MRLGVSFSIARHRLRLSVAHVPRISISLLRDTVRASFDNVVSYGTYADGSFWINGKGREVSVTEMTPVSTTSDRTIAGGGTTGLVAINGAELNPGSADAGMTLAEKQASNFGFSTASPGQGYDEFVASSNLAYSPFLNVDPGHTGQPLALRSGTIVKAVSDLADVSATARPAVDRLVPFTIVTSEPPEGAFRPAPTDRIKTSNYRVADIDTSRFPNLDATGITVPDYATTLASLRFVSWQHTFNALSRNIMPGLDGSPVYGGDFYIYMEAMLACCLDAWTLEQKIEIAKLLIQMGIDIAGRAREGAIWQDNGGHACGRKTLVAFAAHMLGDAPGLVSVLGYKAMGPNYDPLPTPIGASIWGEDAQVMTITQALIDAARDYPYTQDQLGWPEFAASATRGSITDPQNFQNALDLDTPGSEAGAGDLKQAYRHITAVVQVPSALALRLLGAKDIFDNQVYFDYVDRYMQARIAKGTALPDAASNDITAFTLATWSAHRGTQGVWEPPIVVTPDPGTPADPVASIALVDTNNTANLRFASSAIAHDAKLTFFSMLKPRAMASTNELFKTSGRCEIIQKGDALQVILRDSLNAYVYDAISDAVFTQDQLARVYVAVDLATPSVEVLVDGVAPNMTVSTPLTAGTGLLGLARAGGVLATDTGLFPFNGQLANYYLTTGEIIAENALHNAGSPIDLTGVGSPKILLDAGQGASAWNAAANLGSIALTVGSGTFSDV